jgi:hypothetical protein
VAAAFLPGDVVYPLISAYDAFKAAPSSEKEGAAFFLHHILAVSVAGHHCSCLLGKYASFEMKLELFLYCSYVA